MAAGLLTGPTVGDVWSGDALDGDGDLWWEACVLEYDLCVVMSTIVSACKTRKKQMEL